MPNLDPRYAGTASKNDPRFQPEVNKKPNGYKRTKSETMRQNDKTDPYLRDPNDAPRNRLGII